MQYSTQIYLLYINKITIILLISNKNNYTTKNQARRNTFSCQRNSPLTNSTNKVDFFLKKKLTNSFLYRTYLRPPICPKILVSTKGSHQEVLDRSIHITGEFFQPRSWIKIFLNEFLLYYTSHNPLLCTEVVEFKLIW